MTANGILQIALFFLIIVALTKPLGAYMARIFEGPPRRLEKVIYRLCGIDPLQEQTWMQYAGGTADFQPGHAAVHVRAAAPAAMVPAQSAGAGQRGARQFI